MISPPTVAKSYNFLILGRSETTISIGVRSKFQEAWEANGGDADYVGDVYIPLIRCPTKQIAYSIKEHFNELMKTNNEKANDPPFAR